MKRHIGPMMIPLLAALAGCGAERPSGSVGSATVALRIPVLYVDAAATGLESGASWADAFTDLQSALDAAVAGDEIWVAASATPYKPQKTINGATDPRAASFVLKSGVALYGGFAGTESKLDQRQLDPGATVLSGDIGTAGVATDNSYHVVYADGVTDAVLDGFTVTGGYAVGGSGCCMPGSGGGIYAHNSVLTVSSCVFSANVAEGAGGGMYSKDSTLTVSDCVFSGNRASKHETISGIVEGQDFGMGGGMYNEGQYPGGTTASVITGSTFRDNVALSDVPDSFHGGGGMYNREAKVTVDRCLFERNVAMGRGTFGGGMFSRSGEPTITNSVFVGNVARRGGLAVVNYGAINIVNCTFYHNGWWPGPLYAGLDGGTIFQYGPGARIIGSIFSENVVHGGGAAIVLEGPFDKYSTISKCLFHENRGNFWNESRFGETMISHFGPSTWTPDVSDSLLDVDPMLADPKNGDFHLLAGSPAIDAGVTKAEAKLMWPPLPATDFEGDKRIIDDDATAGVAADIGADEYDSQDQQ